MSEENDCANCKHGDLSLQAVPCRGCDDSHSAREPADGPPTITPPTKETNPKDAIGVRKASLANVPATVLAEVGLGMLEGACKYGRYNWRTAGVRASVYYDATMRHLMAWWEGEDVDPDSGLSHVTKAITALVVLRDAMINSKCVDDRPPSPEAFFADLNAKAAEIVDRYAHLSPKHNTIADTPPRDVR